jgi:vacuolar-type H+-ATPase subunit E/Vma4
MEAKEVVEKILAEARGQAEKIKSEAQAKEADEQAKLSERLDEYRKQTEILAEKAGQDKKAHLLAGARMEIAKEFLAEKRRLLDEVFEQSQTQLENLPDKQYCDFWAKLMVEAVETGDEEVIVDNKETRVDDKFIKMANHQGGGDFKRNLRLADERQNIGSGFILKRGRIKVNVSLKVLLAQARNKLEIELAKELFS